VGRPRLAGGYSGPAALALGGQLNDLLGVATARAGRRARVFATVATLQPDGSVQQSVVWVRPDGDDVLFVVGAGSRKERNLRRDPRVSLLVSPPDAPYGYAAIRGTAVLDPDGGPRLSDELALKYVGTTRAEHVAATPEAGGGPPPVAVRVRPERVAGRL
jgi:PPOX class probable F420-dependent enzyme